jgi:glycosyltransferase involved in cell wall biosynthesis
MAKRRDAEQSVRVAVVSPYYPPVMGGAEIQICRLVHELAESGVLVDVYTGAVTSHRPKPPRGVSIVDCTPARGDDRGWHLDLLRKLSEVATPYRAGLLLLSSVGSRATVDAAAQLHRVGTRVVLRLSSQDRFRSLDQSDRNRLASIGHFVVQSAPLTAELITHGVAPEKIYIIPNAPGVVTPLDIEAAQSSPAGRSALFAGRLDPKKNLDVLISAWASVESAFPDATLRIVGSDTWEVWKGRPSLRLDLAKLVQALDLRCVTFVGPRSEKELQREYQSAVLAVSASSNEGMSNFLIEAMAHGLPVICADILANAFVRSIAGNWVFDPRDPSALSAALRAAFATPSAELREVGKRNCQWVAQHLSAQQKFAKYLAVLDVGFQ